MKKILLLKNFDIELIKKNLYIDLYHDDNVDIYCEMKKGDALIVEYNNKIITTRIYYFRSYKLGLTSIFFDGIEDTNGILESLDMDNKREIIKDRFYKIIQPNFDEKYFNLTKKNFSDITLNIDDEIQSIHIRNILQYMIEDDMVGPKCGAKEKIKKSPFEIYHLGKINPKR